MGCGTGNPSARLENPVAWGWDGRRRTKRIPGEDAINSEIREGGENDLKISQKGICTPAWKGGEDLGGGEYLAGGGGSQKKPKRNWHGRAHGTLDSPGPSDSFPKLPWQLSKGGGEARTILTSEQGPASPSETRDFFRRKLAGCFPFGNSPGFFLRKLAGFFLQKIAGCFFLRKIAPSGRRRGAVVRW